MNDTGKRWNEVIGIMLVGLLITAGFAACEQSQPDADIKKEAPAGEAMKDMSSAAGEAMEDTSSAAGEAMEDTSSAAGETK